MRRSEIESRVKSIKRNIKIGKIIFWTSWGCWLLNTIVFLFIQGWHTTAIEDGPEAAIDHICGVGMLIGIFWLIMETVRASTLITDLIDDDLKN